VYAITVREPGNPDVLEWTERPDPTPGAGEVLIEVAATAVNRADLLQRQGHYPPPPGASEILGLECSGRIVGLGPGAEDSGVRVGDKVCALLSGGGYAEQVTVPAGQVLPVPAGADLVEAGGLVEVAATVWSNVFMLAGLQRGETLLVHGGAGGIGTMAIQLATALGARVAVTAGSTRKLDRCAALGADILVNYHEEDFVERVLDATDGRGADVVLDVLGASYLDRNLTVLATSGRLVVIGLQGGAKAEIDLSRLMTKRAAVLATTVRARSASEKAAIVAGLAAHVWPLVADGTVRPVVHASLPLDQVAEAHRIVEAGESVGKVVLSID
jgi:putative PIG3 family NAD(P)H quinone oxidoreductase